MASSFPTAQPSAKTDFDNTTQIASGDQNSQGEDINAIAAKLGHGDSNNAPAANKILRGTATGKSEWDTDFLDEDTMASDSATAVASQQSIKAYVQTTAGNEAGYTANVKTDYGATGDGSTDDTTAIQNALDAAGCIYFPPGTYRVSDSLEYTDNTVIVGAGRGVTIIKPIDSTAFSNSHGIIQPSGWGEGGDYNYTNVTIKHLSIHGNDATCTGDYEGVILARAEHSLLEDVEAYECKEVGINVDTIFSSDESEMWDVRVVNCWAHDNTSEGFQGGCCTYINCHANDNGASGFATYGEAEDLDQAYYVKYIGCTSYGNTSHGFSVAVQTADDIQPSLILGCYSAYNTGTGIVAGLNGTVVSNNIVTHNGEAGILIGEDNVQVLGNMIKNNGQVGATYDDGILISGDRQHTIIANNRVYDDQDTKTQDWGINEANISSPASGNTNQIHNNLLAGNDSGAIQSGPPSRTTTYDIRDNDGYNPVGASAISVSASPFTHTAGVTPEMIHISGGTVSAVAKNSRTLFATTNVSVLLEPGEAVTVTYSVAPTMSKDVK